MLDAISVLVTLAALFIWLNDRFFGFSSTVAMMASGVFSAFAVLALERIGLEGITEQVTSSLVALQFEATLMNVVIGVLLYVAALKINLRLFEQQHVLILILAVVSTLLNTVLTGFATWGLLTALGLPVPLLHSLLFGALISPTDPIATVSILRSVGLPERLEVVIEGESLLNDGVGAVAFTILLGIVLTGEQPALLDIGIEILRDVGGGVVLGILLGCVGGAMSRLDASLTAHVLISLAIILLGGLLARQLSVSYPLAMVAAGVAHAWLLFDEDTSSDEDHLMFWKTVEDVLVAGLFLTLGLMAISTATHAMAWLTVVLILPVVLVCRFLSVWFGLGLDGRGQKSLRLPSLLTWGGLRGGISVALALSLPDIESRNLLLQLSYGVVLFSVLLQAPTIARLFKPDALNRMVKVLDGEAVSQSFD